jgi:hypothetical protein
LALPATALSSRGDMNHASEIFSFKEKYLETNTNVNTATYDSLALSKTERRYKLLTVRKC